MSSAAKEVAWLLKLQEEGKLKKGSKTLERMPKIFPDVRWVLEGFEALNRRRSYGFSGPLSITYESIEAYLRLHGIQKEDDVELFLLVIPQLDDLWMEDYGKRSAEQQERKNRRDRQRGRR